MKQSERQAPAKLPKSEFELESDHDTEVARTILTLSDNNHMDSYSIPRGDHHRNNSINSAEGIMQNQDTMPANYNTFRSLHPTVPPDQSGLQFTHNLADSSPATFNGEATGWGDFDSFVSY
jgi:hypothetical protein